MKIYLDDIRDAPEGWTKVETVEMAIQLLKMGDVEEISLDHDLGENRKTGYEVAKWIEKQVITKGFIPPVIFIHSANPVGRKNIEAAIKRIRKFQEN